MNYRRSLLVSCAIAASAVAGLASAQTAAKGANEIQELVVTAERREQSLQDVPVAISAFTSERRDLVGINTIQDMTNFTPGLNYTSANDRASIRGIGRLTNQHPIATAVAVYDDGIYTTSTVTAGKTPIFTDRVEVLRGPQGTLYGRNSLGGAINVISKRPTKDFYAEVRGTLGNYNHTTLEAAISGPVLDNVQVRLAGNWDKQRKGYYDNLVPGMPSEGNVVDTFYVEGQIQAQLGDNTDVWMKVYGSGWNNGSGGPGARAGTSGGYKGPDFIGFGQIGTFLPSAGFACAPGGVVTGVVNTSPLGCTPASTVGSRSFATNWAQTVSLDQTYGVALQITHHFEGWDFKYIGGGNNYNYTLQSDNGGGSIKQFTIPLRTSPAPACSATFQALGVCGPLTIFPRQASTYREDYHNMSHELNFSSTTDSPLQWIAGLYAYHEGYIQPVFVTAFDQPQLDKAPSPSNAAVQGAVLPPAYQRRVFDNRTKFREESGAAYGQIDWKFTEQLTFTAGLRYTRDFVKGVEQVRVICFGNVTCDLQGPQSLGTLTPPVDVTAALVYLGADPTFKIPTGVTDTTGGANGGIRFVNGFAIRSYDIAFNKVTGTAGFTWQPDDDTTSYFRYSRGYKRGGISSGVTSTEGKFPYTAPEYIDAFDAGLKKNWGGKLVTNVSLFYYPYKNLQAPLTVINNSGALAVSESRFLNVPKSITQGIEIEATWSPIDHLLILANYSYTDAHIKRLSGIIDPADPLAQDSRAKPLTSILVACTGGGSTVTATNPNPNPQCDAATGFVQRPQNLAGNSLPQSPKNKVALSATYTFDLPTGTVSPSVSYVWRDKQYAGLFERDYNASPSWDQVDARVSYHDKADHFTAILFVKNAFNTLGYDGGSSVSRVTGVYSPATIAASNGGVKPGTIATAGTVNGVANTPLTFNGLQGFNKSFALTPPRTYGLELQYRF